MWNIAIIDDEKKFSDELKAFITKYGEQKNESFNVSVYSGAVEFLTFYNGTFDLVFLDIDMPDIDGFSAAKRLRKKDENVPVVFVTHLGARYAVKGYEVDALDYIVKPVSYYDFALKFSRALGKLKKRRDVKVSFRTDDGFKVMYLSQLKYVECVRHSIYYYSTEGNFEGYGTLKKVEEWLPKGDFVRISQSFIVNLRYVSSVSATEVSLSSGESLPLSRTAKTTFMQALNAYLAEGR